MTFEDLPDDWRERPLTDPTLVADVLDLVVTDRDRVAGGLALLLCDAEGRLRQPVVVAVQHPVVAEEKAEGVAKLCAMLGEVEPGGGVHLAVVRPSGPFVTDDDREWREVVDRVGAGAGVGLLGCWIVTRHVVRPIPQSSSRATSGSRSAGVRWPA